MVESPRFCRRCGAGLPEEPVFCPKCGERIAASGPATPAAHPKRSSPARSASGTLSIVFGIIIGGGGFLFLEEGGDPMRRAFQPEQAAGLRFFGVVGLVVGLILIVVGAIGLSRRS